MKVLITGSNGLLGQKIVRQAIKKEFHFLLHLRVKIEIQIVQAKITNL